MVAYYTICGYLLDYLWLDIPDSLRLVGFFRDAIVLHFMFFWAAKV